MEDSHWGEFLIQTPCRGTGGSISEDIRERALTRVRRADNVPVASDVSGRDIGPQIATQQRVPVRVALDHERDQVALVAGRSATVEVIGDRKAAGP
jgi:hypothetical protein